MNFLITAVSIAIFIAGLWCYGLAFDFDNPTLQLLTFLGGILLNLFACFIPWQLTGTGRK